MFVEKLELVGEGRDSALYAAIHTKNLIGCDRTFVEKIRYVVCCYVGQYYSCSATLILA